MVVPDSSAGSRQGIIMEPGTHVEYETGIAEYGIGFVTHFNEQTEMVTVTDEEDGSTWRGPLDRVTPTGE